MARENGESEAVTCYGGGVDPRNAGADGEVIDEEPGFKIVRAVENQRKAGEQFRHVSRSQVGDHAFDLNIGIDGTEISLGGNSFRQGVAGVGFVEERLSLEI